MIVFWSVLAHVVHCHLSNAVVKMTLGMIKICIKKGDSITYNFCFLIRIHYRITIDSQYSKLFSVVVEGIMFRNRYFSKKLNNTLLSNFASFVGDVLLSI